MVKAVVFSLAAGIGGLFIATKFIPGVSFAGSATTLLILGVILGIVLLVVRPFLALVSFLLRILLIGAVTFVIVWVLTLVFPTLAIAGITALVLTTAVIGGIAIIFSIF